MNKLLILFALTGCATDMHDRAPKSESLVMSACSKPFVEYRNNTIYHKQDDLQVDVASVRCGELYTNSPCLVKVIKISTNDYHAVCGKKKEHKI
jgi:hypothetical protein